MPAESPEAAVRECQQDAAMAVSGKEHEEGEENGDGENGDETEGTEDQQQGGEGDEDVGVYTTEDEDERNEHFASSDSDVGEPEEENVVESGLQVVVAPEAAPDSEVPKEPPLTELKGNASEVSRSGCTRAKREVIWSVNTRRARRPAVLVCLFPTIILKVGVEAKWVSLSRVSTPCSGC